MLCSESPNQGCEQNRNSKLCGSPLGQGQQQRGHLGNVVPCGMNLFALDLIHVPDDLKIFRDFTFLQESILTWLEHVMGLKLGDGIFPL
jgi:hypothetical protein